MRCISVAIDKQKFWDKYHPKYDMLNMAYTMLIERFDKYLHEQNSRGMIRIDRTTDRSQYKMNETKG